MKRFIATLLALLLLCLSCATAEHSDGAWCVAEDIAITEENQALFDRAMEGLLGVEYVPLAYLGSQVVAGMNHCYLCRATVVYPGATPPLVLVYLYEGVDGHVELVRIADLDLAAMAAIAE